MTSNNKSYPTAHEFNDPLISSQAQQEVLRDEREAEKLKWLRAETAIAEKRRDVMHLCSGWMKWTVGISAALLALVLLAILVTLGALFLGATGNASHAGFLALIDNHSHFLMFLVSVLAAYSLLAPYLLLKGILAKKGGDEPPFTETVKDGVEAISKPH